MPAIGLPLRSDYDGDKLRLLAGTTRGLAIKKRLFTIALIYDGASRTEAAERYGVSLQAIRIWVMRFNEGGPDALRNNYVSARQAEAKHAAVAD